MKDEMFLQSVSKPAGKEDLKYVQDLIDTIQAHKEACVGMAANMIGIQKRIIVFFNERTQTYETMLNPEIIKTSKKKFRVNEGCLSFVGEREAMRYERIKVRYQDMNMNVKIHSYDGFTAQIIQHEIDHCNGVRI